MNIQPYKFTFCRILCNLKRIPGESSYHDIKNKMKEMSASMTHKLVRVLLESSAISHSFFGYSDSSSFYYGFELTFVFELHGFE